jgi:hypothetical protein
MTIRTLLLVFAVLLTGQITRAQHTYAATAQYGIWEQTATAEDFIMQNDGFHQITDGFNNLWGWSLAHYVGQRARQRRILGRINCWLG